MFGESSNFNEIINLNHCQNHHKVKLYKVTGSRNLRELIVGYQIKALPSEFEEFGVLSGPEMLISFVPCCKFVLKREMQDIDFSFSLCNTNKNNIASVLTSGDTSCHFPLSVKATYYISKYTALNDC